jgi:NADH:ubiquinone oxidoreductase subunit 5 (subunit L)/multisubunit Na+/H+ antiporter MnhA subunit
MAGLFGSVFHLQETPHSMLILPGIPLITLVVMAFIGIQRAKRQENNSNAPRLVMGLDTIYDRMIVSPYIYLSKVITNQLDRYLSQGILGMGIVIKETGFWLVRLQTGNIGTYIALMLFAVLVLLIRNLIG